MIRRIVALLLVVCALAGLAACGDDGDGGSTTSREADVYAAILGSIAIAAQQGEETPVIYVAPLGNEKPIALDVQVSVVDTLGSDAVVRFVDDAEQAIDKDADGAPVFDDGVLVHLGAVPEEGTTITVPGELYRDERNVSVVDFTLSETADGWALTDAQPQAEAAG